MMMDRSCRNESFCNRMCGRIEEVDENDMEWREGKGIWRGSIQVVSWCNYCLLDGNGSTIPQLHPL